MPTPRPPSFPSPFKAIREPLTLVELRMSKLSGEIRNKPNWWEKVLNSELVAKWREEMRDQDRALVDKLWGGEERNECRMVAEGGEADEGEDGDDRRGPIKEWPRDAITDAQLDYIFDDLRFDAEQRYDKDTGIYPAPVWNVYESRSLISDDLKAALVEGATVLESVPEEEKDWHPGSDNQVLDLVHPSLYCLRIGYSSVINRGAAKKKNDPVHVLTKPEYIQARDDFNQYSQHIAYAISDKYQWLPTDFKVSAEGAVTPVGYINNIHPIRHKTLYPAISSILGRFIPLFERVLGDVLISEQPHPVDVDPYQWYEHLQEPPDEPEDEYEEWVEKERWPRIPDPAPFDAAKVAGALGTFNLRGRTLQVIVKMANIVLTPERPAYAGGAWHVEGMANEKIVATGLYYYACANIGASRLAFRQVVGDDEAPSEMPYEQGDTRGYSVAYGFSAEDPLNQVLGHILAEEGKCVAFPNVYQHRVEPFELVDKTRPGVRKILCFFLVDPETRILSTTDVPPQQEEWARDEVNRAPVLNTLPQELFDMVLDYARVGTVSRKQAEEDRLLLMAERSRFVKKHNEQVFELPFGMCEH